MSFTAQCTPSSRASGAGSAPGLPKPLCLKRKGVDLVHVCDTANHSIVCVCFSCCGWKPNETALAADPGKLEERFVWVLKRKVNGTSNVRWICMGCRVQATSGITRLRNHLTCVKKAGAQVRRYSARCAFPPTETLPRTPQPCDFPIPGAKELLGPTIAAAVEKVEKLKEQKGDREESNAVLSLSTRLEIQQTPRTTRPLRGLPSTTCRSPPWSAQHYTRCLRLRATAPHASAPLARSLPAR